MLKEKYRVLGVMSGTSLDGIDLAYVDFRLEKGQWTFNCTVAETLPYPKVWVDKLQGLIALSETQLHDLDAEYTQYLAKTIKAFINKNKLHHIDAVCSHGHTALHQPKRGFTYQIGNKAILAKLLNHVVVCDFRVQDVALGGEGAPLVPIGDALLFSAYDFCLNLGGFANISTALNNTRIAYDICPANIVLNYYAAKQGLEYDKGGRLAASGTINEALLTDLEGLAYYSGKPPKSLGLEWVKATFLPVVRQYDLQVRDVLCTLCEHIALQIARAVNIKQNATVLATGGGAYNAYLIKRLEHHTLNSIVVPNHTLVDFKEAIVFALLGVLRLRGETNCLASVTGAAHDHSSGMVFTP
ncbi:anhydro-N-acetylmuramic acid kinase [Mangrovimonas yunxiaonensis]|uniref:Anhydro-N-acetylmuramic acid kinase n=1 Tax=Mangrovimonas yunxiaonensis TaxID=1197477 RepID=A0A084TIQ6_9FLAO|nr:anhydro-N-acetylmuramic acid kinase [Mangrovimonas yunxiaonensis]KFB00592.1 anhydro-N-acetylmuramic acid kinase [Mangrovimonas yunxiaonensis]GGH46948.1 anhydro-N-acetylmuramic acid kinase [Mangrovimonas yunxiaonensis]